MSYKTYQLNNKKTQGKRSERFAQTLFQGRYMNNEQAHEEMLSIIRHQGKCILNHNKIYLYASTRKASI